MRKALERIKAKWKVLLVTVVAVAGICVFLSWIWNRYGQNYVLTWVSLLIAFTVAIIAIYSLKLTRDSLELTRATARPFLVLMRAKYVIYEGNCQIKFLLCNTGSLPASDISIGFEFKYLSESIENGDAKSFLHDRQTQHTLLPNEERECLFTLIPLTKKLIVTRAERCLTLTIIYRFDNSYFHIERKFFVPIEVRKLDRDFDFLPVREQDYWR